MSVRQAVTAAPRMHDIRQALSTLGESSGGRRAPSKRGRTDALSRIRLALRETSVRGALTFFTYRELTRGEREQSPDSKDDRVPCPLSWTELCAELLFSTARAAQDAARSSRPGVNNMGLASDSMAALRNAVSLALKDVGGEALWFVMSGFVSQAATWLSDVKRAPLMDDAWQCLTELLEVPCLRARLPPAYIGFWANACYEQISGVGSRYRQSPAATTAARRGFVLLASETLTSDSLLRKCPASQLDSKTVSARREFSARGENRSRSSAHDTIPVYALIVKRACQLFEDAKEKSRVEQRDIEATALSVLGVCLAERCAELYRSDVAEHILECGAPGAVACWTERRHRPHALKFALGLARVLPCDVGNFSSMDLIRERVQADFDALAELLGRLSAQVQNEPENDLIEVASFMFSTREVLKSLTSLRAPRPTLGVVSSATAWLRVLHVQLLRRGSETMTCFFAIAHTVVSLFDNIGGDGRVLPSDCTTWACRVLSAVVAIAESLIVNGADRGSTFGSWSGSGASTGVSFREPGGSAVFGDGIEQSAEDSLMLGSSEECSHADDGALEAQKKASNTWRRVFDCLVRQLMRARTLASRHESRNTDGVGGTHENQVSVAETHVLELLTFLLYSDLLSSSDLATGIPSGSGSDSDSFWSLGVFDMRDESAGLRSAVLKFVVAHVAVAGFPVRGASLRSRLIRGISSVCFEQVGIQEGLPSTDLEYAGLVAASMTSGASLSRSVSDECCNRVYGCRIDRYGLMSLPECTGFLDALLALHDQQPEHTGSEATSRSIALRTSRRELERLVFPAGGGWVEDFFPSDSEIGRCRSCHRNELLSSSARMGVMSSISRAPSLYDEHFLDGLVWGLQDLEERVADGTHAEDETLSLRSGRRKESDDARRPKRHQGAREALASEFSWGRCLDADCDDVSMGGFRSAKVTSSCIRMVSFLAHYILTLMELDGVGVGAADGGPRRISGWETKLVRLLVVLLKRLCATEPKLISVRSSVLEIPHAFRACHRLLVSSQMMNYESCPGEFVSTLRSLLDFISDTFQSFLVGSVLDEVDQVLKGFIERAVSVVSCTSVPAETLKETRCSSRTKRSRPSGKRGGILPPSKKRSKTSERHRRDSSGFESWGDDIPAQSSGFHEDSWSESSASPKHVEEAEDDGSDWGSPEPIKESRTIRNDADPSVVEDFTASRELFREDCALVRNLCRCLEAVHETSQMVADEIVDRLAKCLELCRSLEKRLSPDDCEQDMVCGSSVCEPFLETRACLWDTLFAIASVKGFEVATEDALLCFEKLKGLRSLQRGLLEAYEEEFGFETRSSGSGLLYNEFFRCVLMSYFSRYLESCLGVGLPTRVKYPRSAMQKQLVHRILVVADETESDSCPRSHTNIKLLLLRVLSAATELVLGPTKVDVSSVTPFDEASTEVCVRLRTRLIAFVQDLDPRVQIAAGGVIPILLRSRICSLDGSYQDVVASAVSKILTCSQELSRQESSREDVQVGYNGAAMLHGEAGPCGVGAAGVDTEKVPRQASRRSVFSRVSEKCRKIVVVTCLSEIGSLSPDDRASIVLNICVRAVNCEATQISSFGALVRIACRSGYEDPSALFDAHRRLVISKWVQMWKRKEVRLEAFPGSLVLRGSRGREGGSFDWLSENADELVPIILSSDNANNLSGLAELSDALNADVPSLISKYAVHVYRVFPMLFSTATNSKGLKLWNRIWEVAQDGGVDALQSIVRSHPSNVLCDILASATCGKANRLSYSCDSEGENFQGFVRSVSHVRPPEYDPWLCLLAVARISSGSASAADDEFSVLDVDALNGSIFENLEVLQDLDLSPFSRYVKKKPMVLAKALCHVYHGLVGPPFPSSSDVRRNSFMLLGMLYLAAEDVLLTHAYLRITFFDLILKGFHFYETAKDARWLLRRVSEAFIAMEDTQVNSFRKSAWLGCLLSKSTGHLQELLECGSRSANRWWEILELFLPGLVSIACAASEGSLVCHARESARELLGAARAQGAEVAIARLDPLPDGKLFKSERLFQDSCFASFVDERTISPEVIVEFRLWRFNCSRVPVRKDCPAFLARLKTLRIALETHEDAVRALYGRLEASPVDDFEIVIGAVSYLLSLFDSDGRSASSSTSNLRALLQGSFAERGLGRASRGKAQDCVTQVNDEAIRCLCILGPLWGAMPTQLTGRRDLRSAAVEPALDAFRALCRELRSMCAVSRHVAVDILPAFLATPAGSHAMKTCGDLIAHDLKLFIQRTRRTAIDPAPRFDPRTGFVSSEVLPDFRKVESWKLFGSGSRDTSSFDQWARRFASGLCSLCENLGLRLLEPMCFASLSVAMSMFPLLLFNVVCSKKNDSELVRSLSQGLTTDILENPRAPVEAVRLTVQGLDYLCQIGLEEMRQTGVPKTSRARDGNRDTKNAVSRIFVLDIPYDCAAKAANRCGAFFSALRFASLFVDHACSVIERGLRSQSRSNQHFPDVVKIARQNAHCEVANIISCALKGLAEVDGQRAVSQSQGMLARASLIASVDQKWARLLGSSDALDGMLARQGSSAASGLMSDGQEHGESQLKSLAQHRDIVRSLLGMGAPHSVLNYWQGLTSTLSGTTSYVNNTPFRAMEYEAASDLLEMRYQAAWQLGNWSSQDVPAGLLPLAPSTQNENGVPSFGPHRALHCSLRALSIGDAKVSLSYASDARERIANRLAESFRASGGVVSDFRSAADAFAWTEDVSLASCLLARSQQELYESGGSEFVGSSLVILDSAREPASGVGYDAPYRTLGSRFTSVIDKLQPPEESFLAASGGSLAPRFRELCSFWDRESLSVRNVHVGSATGLETKFVLRLLLARTLGVKSCVPRLAADAARRTLEAACDEGSWSRASAVLGSQRSACLASARDDDKAAWLLAEARLRWAAGEDGHSKLSAVQDVKTLIASYLGGVLKSVSGVSAAASEARFQFQWKSVTSDMSSTALASLRAEACGLVAQWSSTLHEEEPIKLFRGYLEMGLGAFEKVSGSDGLCSTHFAMADFANKQLVSIDKYRKTKEYIFRSNNVDSMKAKKKDLQDKLCSMSLRDHQKRSMQRFMNELEKNIARENEKVESLNGLYREWQLLAAQNYSSCLRAGNEHDLRAAFRLVSLWMEHAEQHPSLNDVLCGEVSPDPAIILKVPASKLLPLAPQIASRLGKSSCQKYDQALSTVLTKLTCSHFSHCIWLLVALSNLTRPVPAGLMKKKTGLYVGDSEKKAAADRIIDAVRDVKPEAVEQTLRLMDYYISVSEIPRESRRAFPQRGLPKVTDLTSVTVPTYTLPLFGSDVDTSYPHVIGFKKKAKVLNGLSTPMLIQCLGSDGQTYNQIVKYEDDMRQDAVMEQLFGILNELLRVDSSASSRNLRIRTYRVVPLSPFAGVMQFVSNTEALREYLLGSTDTDFKFSAHGRHRPDDLTYSQIITAYGKSARQVKSSQLRLMEGVWPRFQPVFRYFFLETFSDPVEWHLRQLAYTRSTAVMSIVGWLVGLGDRHLSNVLMDRKTAELVHIDFGVAFETGKLLPTPELMPFRLSRDIVDGMGIDGVEGVFRTSCEVTMRLLRESKNLILMIIEVFLHDPLCNWALDPNSALQGADGDCEMMPDPDGLSASLLPGAAGSGISRDSQARDVNAEAQQVLSVVSEKLDGRVETDQLSVESHVARLIDIARSFDIIACAYIGWCCYA